MSACCEDKACEIEALRGRQTRTLKIILAINAVMFVVEAAAGLAAQSAAVLAIAVHKILNPVTPDAETIGGIGLLALAANSVCAWLLLSHRHEDLNMHSVWLCSRNDLVHNLAVIGAGIAVGVTGSRWPDIVVGLAIAALFLYTSFGVIGRSAAGLRAPATLP